MEIELEQKNKETESLAKKIGLPDSKVIEELNKLCLNKISSKTTGGRFIDRVKILLNYHNYTKNKKEKKTKVFK